MDDQSGLPAAREEILSQHVGRCRGGREVMVEASREHILARIKASLGDARQQAGFTPPNLGRSVSEVQQQCERDRSALIEQFSSEFTKVRGHVHAVRPDSIEECLLAIASEYSAKRV